ncbi:AcrR family transcriptional regulator [Actinoalloteichus hoggarensis]|uniref:HTH-type transcriptional regulator SrpR n=1 Tax=Actinoalloteichus hoggarensis TaxID=1470176 RepID=A0A221W750_9PSEU|nr:TetR/AcrR family transcriptional regulator [Actinoalloteichus hoggarensis]ASO21705.1 HTH-type transcriptional regulator SrpR [Actinoalloteichus hoggarensis]MBB5922299.1 AcrR family transcriptional regulator [Actinoalloteichus hoggarensis]
MARLNRAETQERNRARVLAAARAEFADHGFRDTKVDAIAERAELTRGAVYSNFPGKRALYFAVLAETAGQQLEPSYREPGRTPREALGALARAWVTRLPLADTEESHGAARLGTELLSEVLGERRTRLPFAQLLQLDALLLGLALENLTRPHPTPRDDLARLPTSWRAWPGRLVRVAETVLTTLHGASQLAAAAPGFLEPFNVVKACEQAVDLDLDDGWTVPPFLTQAEAVDAAWTPQAATDLVRDAPAVFDDGVVAVLGLHRLAAAEDAVRALPAGSRVTAVLVTSEPGELAPLARLVLADLAGCLRQAFPESAWPRLQVVLDESGALASAAGVPAVSDGTEVAVRVEAGRIVARADGRGACHVVASSDGSMPGGPDVGSGPRRRP